MRTRVSLALVTTIAIVAASGLAVAGCGGQAEPDHRPPTETATVQLFRVEAGVQASQLTLAGRIRAREEVTITATVGGRVTALPFSEGAAFQRDQVLVRFSAPEAERALEAARAGERATALRWDEARLQETRMDSLFASRVAAKRELELARIEARAAQAAHEQARATLAAIETGVAVRAPFDGVTVRPHVDVGANVQPGAKLVTIRSRGAAEIEVAVPESWTERVRGADAWYRVGATPWRSARLSRIEGMTDPTTRTRLAFLRPVERDRLEPGAHAQVRLSSRNAEASRSARGTEAPPVAGQPTRRLPSGASIMIPSASVVRRGALRGVFVAHHGHAQLRWVSLGHDSGDTVEVLAGVWPGEDVVLDPAGLEHGQPVEVP